MTRPAPYPSDTRAKGWRFELDHERIRQSDTWALAAPEVRPWLLMLWMTAWEQTPCGSLPADDELIAARIGMPLDMFTQYKPRLMRGWWLADDGRMYQDTVAERVLEMIERRDGEAKRKAEYRARKQKERQDGAARAAENVPSPSHYGPEMSHGTDGGLTRDSGGSDATGTGTGTSNKTKEIAAAASHACAHTREECEPPIHPDLAKEQKAMTIATWLRRREKKRGKQPKGTQSSDPRIGAWIEAGATGRQLAEAYELAVLDRQTSGNDSTISPGFLDVFVNRILNPPVADSALAAQRPAALKADPLAWLTSASGLQKKGEDLGIQQGASEAFPHFRERVIAAAALTDQDKARARADLKVHL